MSYAVLTRELEADSPYASALATLGLVSIAMPVTRTAPPGDPGALSRALAAGGHAAVVITSPRAAAALAEARGGREIGEVWAVGPSTLRALTTAGIHGVHPEGVLDGTSLAHAMLGRRELAGRRVLVPRAEHGREEVSEILRAAGVEIDLVVAYRTVPAPLDDPALTPGRDLVAAGRAEVVCVFAPSQVTALRAIVGDLGGLTSRFAAIGDTTAAALREAGVGEVAVATAPTPEGLATAVGAVYPGRR